VTWDSKSCRTVLCHHHRQFICSTTKQYKYSDKRWYKWSWNGNDNADSTYSHPSVLKT